MKKGFILLITIALSGTVVLAQYPKVEIQGSEVRTLFSSIVNQEYKLQIQLPGGYAAGKKKYPVVYLMDSQWDFPLLGSLYRQQYYDGFIPEMIIVGVTWGGPAPNPDSLRARDYTPTKENGAPQSGGAPAFLSFMKKELFPFIEANYDADKNDRTLMGCSLGGLFTLYALFTEPGLFQRYVAASPAFGWDREVIYKFEKEYFDKTSNPPARLFMSMGGVERGVPGFEKLVNHLASRNYKTLQIKSRVLENTGHSGTKGEGYVRGLQYAYERPSLNLDAAIINKYIGTYQVNNGPEITIKNEGNALAIYAGSNPNKTLLYAASETDFYLTSEFLNIHFNIEGGKVTGFQLNRYGSSQFIAKK